jgi:hypothetical protein
VVTTAAGDDRGPWLTRPVLLAGLGLGTFVTASAVYSGARPRLGSLPMFLPLVLGTLAELLVIVAAATVLAALLRRHHRALLGGAWRHGRRGAVTAFRASRTRGGSLLGRLTAWAAPRWQGRADDQAPPDDLAEWLRAPMPDPRLNDAQRERDANGKGHLCAACGHPGTPDDPLVISDGYRVHRSHTTDPQDGFHDPAAAPADAGTQPTGDTTMTTATTTTGAPAGWKTLAAGVADFEPADDGELLAWMASEVAGMLAYGEALVSVHETCVSTVRLDPAAMAAMHDVADAAADAAEAMARAIEKFKQVYEAPRGFVADGGVLPRDGDFITGDDEA